MKLTIEADREAIQRYRHLARAPSGVATCSARCPGTTRNCTLRRGHGGPHVSHGAFRRVLAVWDKGAGAELRKPFPQKVASPPPARSPGEEGVGRRILRLLRSYLPGPQTVEATALLSLVLTLTWFFAKALLVIFTG